MSKYLKMRTGYSELVSKVQTTIESIGWFSRLSLSNVRKVSLNFSILDEELSSDTSLGTNTKFLGSIFQPMKTRMMLVGFENANQVTHNKLPPQSYDSQHSLLRQYIGKINAFCILQIP